MSQECDECWDDSGLNDVINGGLAFPRQELTALLGCLKLDGWVSTLDASDYFDHGHGRADIL